MKSDKVPFDTWFEQILSDADKRLKCQGNNYDHLLETAIESLYNKILYLEEELSQKQDRHVRK